MFLISANMCKCHAVYPNPIAYEFRKVNYMPSYTRSIEQIISSFLNNQTEKNAVLLFEKMTQVPYYVALAPFGTLDQAQRTQIKEKIDTALVSGDWSDVPLLLVEFNSDNGAILPLYTSEKQMQKDGMTDAGIKVSFNAVYSLLKSREDIGVLFINPKGDPISFMRDQFLESFAKRVTSTSTAQFEAGEVVTFENGAGKALPEAVKALLLAAAGYPEIKKVWLARSKDSEKKNPWMIVVESDAKRPDSYKGLAEAFIQLQQDGPVMLAFADDEISADIVATFAPVYTR